MVRFERYAELNGSLSELVSDPLLSDRAFQKGRDTVMKHSQGLYDELYSDMSIDPVLKAVTSVLLCPIFGRRTGPRSRQCEGRRV